MSAIFLKHFAIEIPDSDKGVARKFYTDFGLNCTEGDTALSFACSGRKYASIKVLLGAERKRLHHVCLGFSSDAMEALLQRSKSIGVPLVPSPEGFEENGVCFESPEGVLFHCVEAEPETEVMPEAPFLVNSPGQCPRINQQALPFKSTIPDVKPRRLGHVALFAADVSKTAEFLIDVLGMKLSDRSEDVVAFLHFPGGSDHHVIALAKSGGPGLHHCSFFVGSPDEVGLGGCRMIEKGYDKGWGFGRHSIGSNFFHYVRDPWGSYAEYFCDMDYIADSDSWSPQNWPLEDSLHSWGPNPPEGFIDNLELN